MRRYSCDVFLSIDAADVRAGADGDGWIARIRHGIASRLSALLGTQPVIGSAPSSAPADAATMICFVSPRSRTSATCAAEREAFAAAATPDAPAEARVFSLLVAPIAVDQIPASLQPYRSFALFAPQAGEVVDDKRFWIVIDDLAHALAAVIQGARSTDTSASQTTTGTHIYMAETSADLFEEHDRIRRELQRHGHHVHPTGVLPGNAADAEKIIRSELSQCVLSINLIGADYGRVPAGGSSSMMELQHRLALEQCQRDPSFHHVIWIPPSLVSADARQNAFLASLRQFTEVERGTELVQTALEDFKALVEDKLRLPVAPAAPPAESTTTGTGPLVYLMYDQKDSAAVAPLQEYAVRHGITVIPSVFEGDQTKLREIHQQNLRMCDAALIVYGNVREPWVRIKQQDLLKAAGFGRSRQMIAKAIYVGPVATESKRQFNAQEVMVIKDFEGVSPSAILPFLEKLRSATRGGVSA